MFTASRPAALAFLIVPLLGLNVRSCRHLGEQLAKKSQAGPLVGKAATAGTKPRSFADSLAKHAHSAHLVRAKAARDSQAAARDSPALPPTLVNDPDLVEGNRLRAAGEYTEALAAYQRGLLKAEARFGKDSSEARFFRSRLKFVNPFLFRYRQLPSLQPSSMLLSPAGPQAQQ